MSFTFTKLSFQVQAKPLLACVWRSDGNGAPTPARDRVIEFGKHKGKMLGTLPSTYLKWVSKNLRAREFEEWAILADQVLDDPVYQDRIQWEFAHNILSGKDKGKGNSTRATGDDVVSDLLEISERFGWDWDNNNTQTSGWSNVNFELLGTSKGGRIPRINATSIATATETSESKMKKKQTVTTGGGGGGRRRERRDRLRMKREKSSSPISKSKGAVVENSEIKPTPLSDTQTDNPRIRNPFPGRQSLLNRATK